MRAAYVLVVLTLGMLWVISACAPVATPTPTATPTAMPTPTPTATLSPLPTITPTPTPTATPGAQPPAGTQVAPVDGEATVDGVTVGVKELWISEKETVVKYTLDCGPSERLEQMRGGPYLVADLGGAQLALDQTSGTGGRVCDASEVKEVRFRAVPRGTRALTFRYESFMGTEPREVTLDLAVGSYLAKLDPKFGGEVALDVTAESNGLAYRFTKLSAGVAGFSLTYEPANEAARSQLLGGMGASGLAMEDDRGHTFTSEGSSGARWSTQPDLVLREGTLSFKGAIDTSASKWTLRGPRVGKVYTGPWEVRVDVGTYVAALPGLLPPPLPTPTPTPRPTQDPARTPSPPPTIVAGFRWPSRLKEALSWVPQEFADKPLKFADYQGARAAVGMEDIRGMEAVRQAGPRLFDGPYGKLPYHDTLSNYWEVVYSNTGLDFFASDLGIWLDTGPRGPITSSSFMALQGPVEPEGMSSRLKAIEYKEAEYGGVSYFWLFEEPKIELRHPLRVSSPALNRVAFVDARLLVASTTPIIQSLIDVQRGKAPTLAESKPHAAIADGVGDGLLGAAFVPPGWITEFWNTPDAAHAARLDRYIDGPEKWSKLSPYTIGLLGYRLAGQDEETVVAFYYPDPAAAERDAKELERRWSSFYYDPTGQGRQGEVLVTRSCAPLVTKVATLRDGSVLVGSCKTLPKAPGVAGAGLWQTLLWMGELQFMAPDVEELKRAVGQR